MTDFEAPKQGGSNITVIAPQKLNFGQLGSEFNEFSQPMSLVSLKGPLKVLYQANCLVCARSGV
jgi:hypothetical protein